MHHQPIDKVNSIKAWLAEQAAQQSDADLVRTTYFLLYPLQDALMSEQFLDQPDARSHPYIEAVEERLQALNAPAHLYFSHTGRLC